MHSDLITCTSFTLILWLGVCACGKRCEQRWTLKNQYFRIVDARFSLLFIIEWNLICTFCLISLRMGRARAFCLYLFIERSEWQNMIVNCANFLFFFKFFSLRILSTFIILNFILTQNRNIDQSSNRAKQLVSFIY